MATEAVEQAIPREIPAAPPIRLDDQGRAISPTENERRARDEALKAGLKMMATIADDLPGSDEEFWRALDAGRPERPLLTRYYRP